MAITELYIPTTGLNALKKERYKGKFDFNGIAYTIARENGLSAYKVALQSENEGPVLYLQLYNFPTIALFTWEELREFGGSERQMDAMSIRAAQWIELYKEAMEYGSRSE